MTYNLDFHPDAFKEWHKPDEGIKGQFKKNYVLSAGKRQDNAAYKKALKRDI